MNATFPEKAVLHRAEWIVPVLSPPAPDGAVLTRNGRVVAAGAFSGIRRDIPSGTKILDHGSAAIMPALVNAHTHLDLSALKGAMTFPRTGFPDWIGAFFPLRAGLGQDAMREGFFNGWREIFETGTALCGDVTNGAAVNLAGPDGLPERHTFLELLGFNCESVAAAAPPEIDLSHNGAGFSAVPHSPYSVSPRVIAEAKDRARALGRPFSIHTAEHPEELEFLKSGTGFCRELLEKLGRWEQKWRPPGKSPVRYLDSLGALDRLTLLVHAVHMDDADREIVAARKCAVCFCPRSNRNLGVGRPEIEKALSLGIPACLGTDSLASNTDLNLFAEAGFVLDEYPGIRPDTILEMLTASPARALGREADFGCIGPGLGAALIAVTLYSGLKGPDLAEALIQSGRQGAWKWVNPPATS
ncbi:MAG: amidohydrolase family protein [Syntrophobacteraceae bacterium]